VRKKQKKTNHSRMDSVQWFEQLCENLSRNPHDATRLFEEFRESENVFEVCLAVLQSGQSTPQGKFHALSSLQYAILLKWENLAQEDQVRWLQLFETFIFQAVQSNFPTFLSNKLIQVFCSIQKKRWVTATAEEKTTLYQWLTRFFQPSYETEMPNPSYFTSGMNNSTLLAQLGVNIILSLLEEFTKKSSADLGVHGVTYLQRKVDFETTLLPHLFSLLMSEYQKQLERVFLYTAFVERTPSSSHSNSPMGESGTSSELEITKGVGEELLIALLLLIVKAIIEMITWEYGETVHKSPHFSDLEREGGGGSTALGLQISKPPKHFRDFLINLPFLEKNFHFYQKLHSLLEDIKEHAKKYAIRNKKSQKVASNVPAGPSPVGLVIMNHNTSLIQQSFHTRREKLENCLLELRNLFYALSLMNGEMFSSQDSSEKLSFGNAILSHCYQLAVPHLYRNQLSLLTFDATDYSEGFIRYEELLFFLQLISYFFQNYTLQECIKMPSFPLFFQFISSMALEICKELSLLTNDMTVTLVRSNYADITTTSENNILQTWRFDLLFQILEIFIMIHDDFLLTSSVTFNNNHLTDASHQNNNNTIALLQKASAEKILLQSSLKTFLHDFSQNVFPVLFEIMMVIFVNDSLSSADLEENEEEERINSRNLDTFFMGLSSLGRFSIFSSLQFLGNYLSTIFRDYQQIAVVYDQQLINPNSVTIDHSMEMKTLFCLEKIRLCILILSFLLIDNFSLGNNPALSPQSGSLLSQNSLSAKSSSSTSSSEVNMINDWILDSMKNDSLLTLQMVVECFRCVSIIYQFIIGLLNSQKNAKSNNSMNSRNDWRNPCISPYLMQTILYFYSEIFLQYLSPNLTDYSLENLQLYPFLQTLFRDGELSF
jgi:hypothetical protein